MKRWFSMKVKHEFYQASRNSLPKFAFKKWLHKKYKIKITVSINCCFSVSLLQNVEWADINFQVPFEKVEKLSEETYAFSLSSTVVWNIFLDVGVDSEKSILRPSHIPVVPWVSETGAENLGRKSAIILSYKFQAEIIQYM